MNLLKLFKSYKILVTAAVTCLKGDINCVEMKNSNVIKSIMTVTVYTSNRSSLFFWVSRYQSMGGRLEDM